MSVDDELTRWKYLASQAKQGRLTLDPETAKAYDSACQALIDGISGLQNQLSNETRIDGLGNFEWASELRDGLNDVSGGPGNSLQSTLNKYIQVAQLMSETVNANVQTLTGQDHANAHDLRNAAPPA